MGCITKNKLPRVVSGLIVASMLLTISGQVLLLASADEESSVAPWVITLLATVGQTLAKRIPGSRRRLIPDAGGALLWTHPQLILDAVAG